MDTKTIDIYLDQWGRWARNANRIPIDSKSNLDMDVQEFVELGFEVEMDIIINRLLQPFPAVLRRHYIDQLTNTKHMFHPLNRTIEDKAKTQGMSAGAYKNALQIGRHLVADRAKDFSWYRESL